MIQVSTFGKWPIAHYLTCLIPCLSIFHLLLFPKNTKNYYENGEQTLQLIGLIFFEKGTTNGEKRGDSREIIPSTSCRAQQLPCICSSHSHHHP
jgi:hypothetical protein